MRDISNFFFLFSRPCEETTVCRASPLGPGGNPELSLFPSGAPFRLLAASFNLEVALLALRPAPAGEAEAGAQREPEKARGRAGTGSGGRSPGRAQTGCFVKAENYLLMCHGALQ